MKIFSLTLMAFRYFRRYFRRYLFLFLALSFGYGIITSLTGLQAGMEESVYRSAQSHYSGDLTLIGRVNEKIESQIHDVNKILETIKSLGIQIKDFVIRTQVGEDGILYFNGKSVRQKYVLGVDWIEHEKIYFMGLSYSQGNYTNWDPNTSIIISNPVAEELNVQLGDRILLEVYNRTGQINTRFFIVQAIINDASIFGYYKCYIDRSVLNDLIDFKVNEASSIGIYLKEGSSTDDAAVKIHKALVDKGFNLAPLLKNRDELQREFWRSWEGVRYFVITLPVYLSEVAELLSAIQIISYFLYFLMILIIIVSVAVTYRLILHEREKEIGTLQSVGFHSRDVVFLLMTETIILFLCSLITGFLFARLVIWLLGFVSFSMIPSFEIFMQGGRLVPVFTLRTTLINSAIVLAAIIPTVALPVFNASRKPLPEILAGSQ